MEKTKSCKRKMRIAIGILLLEFAYMLFMGIGGVHATDETLPTVDGKLIHSIDHVEITSEMMNRYAKDMDPDIINRITEENGSCTPQEFLRAYTEQDPKFKKTLEQNGFRLSAFVPFPDHHPYSPGDCEMLLRPGVPLLTTEKDYVRLPEKLRARTQAVSIALAIDDETTLAALLTKALKSKT